MIDRNICYFVSNELFCLVSIARVSKVGKLIRLWSNHRIIFSVHPNIQITIHDHDVNYHTSFLFLSKYFTDGIDLFQNVFAIKMNLKFHPTSADSAYKTNSCRNYVFIAGWFNTAKNCNRAVIIEITDQTQNNSFRTEESALHLLYNF